MIVVGRYSMVAVVSKNILAVNTNKIEGNWHLRDSFLKTVLGRKRSRHSNDAGCQAQSQEGKCGELHNGEFKKIVD